MKEVSARHFLSSLHPLPVEMAAVPVDGMANDVADFEVAPFLFFLLFFFLYDNGVNMCI